MKVILLAAGVGRRFGARTKTLPKCLIPLGKRGENLLRRYLDSFRTLNLKNIVIVVGHQKEKIKKECRRHPRAGIRFIFNKNYRRGSIVSLHAASKELNDDCLIMDADVYFPTAILKRLVQSGKKTAFLVDPRSKSAGEEMMLMAKDGRPAAISKKTDPKLKILGEATGFFKIWKKHAPFLGRILRNFISAGRLDLEYEATYTELMKKTSVGAVSVGNSFWTEMDFEEDLKKIQTRNVYSRPGSRSLSGG